MPGRLFLVATPLGHLGDITHRAVEVLGAVRLIACEDTRHSRVLLDRYGIGTPTASLPAFDERARTAPLVDRLAAGDDVALITDAGSPGISDPGEALVAAALAAGVDVVPVPGPSAVVAALSASGLPSGRFHFLGFLPRTVSEARAMLDEVSGLSATVVLYEAAPRLGATLALLEEVLGDRRACVARELTKRFESFARGTLAELRARFAETEARGELVVLVAGRAAPERWSEEAVRDAVEAALARGESLKAAAKALAPVAGWPSQSVYRLGLGARPGRRREP